MESTLTASKHKYNVKKKNTYSLSSKEEQTTDTEEAAIAADPIQGLRKNPHGRNTPKSKNIYN